MLWTSLDTWIVVAGMLSAASCALLGNFLVLRRMSMMGDAISHAVLPGLAIAFIITESRGSIGMFIGAAIAGVLTALFTQWVHRFGRVDQGASMGVVFTTLFAVGLILIVRAADSVDLDPSCVLYGAIELVPLDTIQLGGDQGWAVPRAVVVLSCVLLVNVVVVGLLFKELRITSFDPDLATTLGINASFIHYVLMTLVATTTVAAFETVGSILVIAMLIVPAATAHLLTERLGSMIVVSLIVSTISAVIGHIAAVWGPGLFGDYDTSTAGMMAVVAGGCFIAAMLGSPTHGLIAKSIRRGLIQLQIVREDILALLYRMEELRLEKATDVIPKFLDETMGTSSLYYRLAVRTLVRTGKIEHNGNDVQLTDIGRDIARNVLRSHRLWEAYLSKHLNLPQDHLHSPAERLEHITDADMQRALADSTDKPTRDPQGRVIPPS